LANPLAPVSIPDVPEPPAPEANPLALVVPVTLALVANPLAPVAIHVVSPVAILLNIYIITSVGVQVCDRRPSVRRVLWLTMHNKLLQD
jgi:hypothetical protein